MAEKEATIIIKKIKKGGHGGHGGAWKVAYADFVTAMMCFFLVMWLMGADEETKAAVSHYFNNPTSAWRKELLVKETAALGDMTGAGENVVKGAEGQTPDDLLERPSRPMLTHDLQAQKAGEVLEQMLSDESLMSLDQLKFSLPEDKLFKPGTTDQWAQGSDELLKRLGLLARKYKGRMEIRATYSRQANESGSPIGSYEFQLSRAVALGRHAIERSWVREEQISTKVADGGGREPAEARKIEITLTREPGRN